MDTFPRSTTPRRRSKLGRWTHLLALCSALVLTACGPTTPTAVPATSTTAPASPAPAAASAATPAAASAATPTALAAPSPAATVQAAVASGEVYTATNGLFSVPIPTNWQVREENGIVRLSEPEGKITVALLTVANPDLDSALAEAWKQFDPAFDLQPKDTQEPPSASGVERTLAAFYDDGDETRVLVGVAQLYDGAAYVLLVDGDGGAVEKRAAQVGIIQSGWTLLGLQTASLRGSAAQPVTPAITNELEPFIERQLARTKIPGAAVAIVQDGKVVYAKGFGVRNADSGEPLTPDTRMMIGSTGKSLTTLLMATLVDSGEMEWDTPVVEILPSFRVKDPELSQSLTVRNLVCACTGVPRRDVEFILNANELSAEDTVASLASFEFYTAFGEAFQYSNQMVATGGYVAGVAAGGQPDALDAGYAEALRQRVLEPIGMSNTTLSFEAVQSSENFAVPHTLNLASGSAYQAMPVTMEKVLAPVAPAGAHWSTVNDMANYMITELGQGVAPDGARVVSAENLEVTWEPQIPVDATTSYGLGWLVGTYKDLPLIHHGGNTLGFTSDFAFLPESNLGIIVMTNGGGTNAFNESVRTRLFELVFDQDPAAERTLDFALGQIDQYLAEMGGRITDTLDPAALAPFLGAYAHAELGSASLALENNRLTVDFGEFQAVLKAAVDEDGAPDGYLLIDSPFSGTKVELQTNASGAPELVFEGGVTPYVFERAP